MKKILTLIIMAVAMLVIFPDSVTARNDDGYVNAPGLHLRSSPNSTRDGVTHTDNVIATLSHGDRVTVLANVHGWLRVRHGGREGYVWNTFVTISAAPAIMPVPTPVPVPAPTPVPVPTPVIQPVVQPVQTPEPISIPTPVTLSYTFDSQLAPEIEDAIFDFLWPLHHGYIWVYEDEYRTERNSSGEYHHGSRRRRLYDFQGNVVAVPRRVYGGPGGRFSYPPGYYEFLAPTRIALRSDAHLNYLIFHSFSLMDIDGDGIPEIILMYLCPLPWKGAPSFSTVMYRFDGNEFIRQYWYFGSGLQTQFQMNFLGLYRFFSDSQGRIVVHFAGMDPFWASFEARARNERIQFLTLEGNVASFEPLVSMSTPYEGETRLTTLITNHLTGEVVQHQEGSMPWPYPQNLMTFITDSFDAGLDDIWDEIIYHDLTHIPTMPHEPLTSILPFDALEESIRERLQTGQR